MVLVFLVILFITAAYFDNIPLAGIAMLAIIIYVIAFLVIRIKRLFVKKPKNDALQSSRFEIKASSISEEFYTRIAGVQFRNDAQDVGGFLGYVCSEPTNPHDKNAIAVYRNDNKLIGYIPKNETDEFRRWSQKEVLPCVGFVKMGQDVPLFGKVKVLDGSQEEVDLIVAKYVHWLVSTFGVKFVPPGFSTDKKLRTKKDWLAFLEEYITKMEAELYEEI